MGLLLQPVWWPGAAQQLRLLACLWATAGPLQHTWPAPPPALQDDQGMTWSKLGDENNGLVAVMVRSSCRPCVLVAAWGIQSSAAENRACAEALHCMVRAHSPTLSCRPPADHHACGVDCVHAHRLVSCAATAPAAAEFGGALPPPRQPLRCLLDSPVGSPTLSPRPLLCIPSSLPRTGTWSK